MSSTRLTLCNRLEVAKDYPFSHFATTSSTHTVCRGGGECGNSQTVTLRLHHKLDEGALSSKAYCRYGSILQKLLYGNTVAKKKSGSRLITGKGSLAHSHSSVNFCIQLLV